MSSSVSHYHRKDSASSDRSDEISSEREKKPREKYDSNDSLPSDKPRLSSRTNSSELDSEEDSRAANDRPKIKQGFGAKIKKNWQQVKDKLSKSPVSGHGVKARAPDPTPRKEYADPDQQKFKVWRDKGRELMDNAKALEEDFLLCASRIDEIAQRAQWDVEKNNFAHRDQPIEYRFTHPIDRDYACLGFEFNVLNWTNEALGSLKILGPKSVITSTETQQRDFLLDNASSVGRMEYALTKPVLLSARGIGSARFVDEVMTALREIPAHCQVILDARGNDLGPAELNQLVDVMKQHPVIYQLNLNDNTFCTGEESCSALKRLFDALGPVSHLYLRNTKLNDTAAKNLASMKDLYTCLRHLDIRDNTLSDVGAEALIQMAARRAKSDNRYAPTLDAILLQGNPCGTSRTTAGYLIEAISDTVTSTHGRIIFKKIPVQLDHLNADFSPINKVLKKAIEYHWEKENEVDTFYSTSDNS